MIHRNCPDEAGGFCKVAAFRCRLIIVRKYILFVKRSYKEKMNNFLIIFTATGKSAEKAAD